MQPNQTFRTINSKYIHATLKAERENYMFIKTAKPLANATRPTATDPFEPAPGTNVADGAPVAVPVPLPPPVPEGVVPLAGGIKTLYQITRQHIQTHIINTGDMKGYRGD